MPPHLEALLRAALSATGTEAFVWDLASDTITRMRAGGTLEVVDAARSRVLESIDDEDRAGFEAALRESIEARKPFEREYRSAGRWLCLKARFEGEWLFGTICDITSDKNRRSAFEKIIDNIPDFISRVDLDGRFLYLNRAGETNVYGLPLNALIGKTPEELGFNVVTAWMLREGELRVIETGQQQRIELVNPGKLTGRTLDVLLIPERDEGGRIASILRVTRDVTPMKDAEARWRRLAEAVPQLVWVADAKGKIVYCNPRWYEYTGRREDESLGDAWSALIHPDDRDAASTAWRAALAAGTDYVVQGRLLGANGTYRWFLVRGVPARNEAGSVTEWFGTCTDIHDEIERQEELRQSRARLALAIDAAEMAVFTQDRDLYFTWVRSPRGGFTKEQVLGHNDYDLATDRELIEPLVEMKREALRTQKRMNGVFRLRHPPDDREIWWDIAVEPLHDALGQVAGLVGTARDVTAVKHAEVAMRESEERLRLAARASLAMIYDWDMVTNVTYRSDAVRELTGYGPEETARSEWWISSIHPEDRERAEARLHDAIAKGGDRYENEYRVRHRDGSWRYLWDRGFIVRDASGRAVRAVGSTVDVTARRLAEEELKTAHRAEQEARTDAERANRAKDDFLATLSHELRTPMTSILGWTSMLSSGMVDPATMPLAITAIHDSAQAQAQLIEDLLDVSRITTGKLSIEMRPLDLVSIVASSVESFRVAARTRSIDLRVSIDASDLLILGDEKRMRQIVANLISNALKFTPAGGRVDVALRQDDGNAIVVVRDTGIGIAPQFLPHIFDRFSQQDTSGSREHGGLGLGLAIVHDLVGMHGGRVNAESAGKGRGSLFTIVLPRVMPAAHAVSEPAARSGRGVPRLDGVRVLLVEDEPHSRKYMESVLTSSGAEVQATASVAEALAAEGQPAVVVSDIAMPGEDGISLITKLRTRDALARRRTPAVAVTALGFGDDRRRILSAGFDEYLAKPVEPMQLLETVAALVRK